MAISTRKLNELDFAFERKGDMIGKAVIDGYIATIDEINDPDADKDRIAYLKERAAQARKFSARLSRRHLAIASAYIDCFDAIQTLYMLVKENLTSFKHYASLLTNELCTRYNAEVVAQLEGAEVFDRGIFTADFKPLSILAAEETKERAEKRLEELKRDPQGLLEHDTYAKIIGAFSKLSHEWAQYVVYEEFLKQTTAIFDYEEFSRFSMAEEFDEAVQAFLDNYNAICARYKRIIGDDETTGRVLDKFFIETLPAFDELRHNGFAVKQAAQAVNIFAADITKVADRDAILTILRR